MHGKHGMLPSDRKRMDYYVRFGIDGNYISEQDSLPAIVANAATIYNVPAMLTLVNRDIFHPRMVLREW